MFLIGVLNEQVKGLIVVLCYYSLYNKRMDILLLGCIRRSFLVNAETGYFNFLLLWHISLSLEDGWSLFSRLAFASTCKLFVIILIYLLLMHVGLH